MSEYSDFIDDETGEGLASGMACSQPCPEGDGECALGLGHYARHCCGADHSHRWQTEYPV